MKRGRHYSPASEPSVAFLITGEPRNWESFTPTLNRLLSHGTVIAALSDQPGCGGFAPLADKGVLLARSQSQTLSEVHWNLIRKRGGAVVQWLRYREAIDRLMEFEHDVGLRHTEIRKLRSDFHFDSYDSLVQPLTDLENFTIYANSDIVFGGSRDSMVALRGMFDALAYVFQDRAAEWFPLNLDALAKSDLSMRWYWSRFPLEIFSDEDDCSDETTVIKRVRFVVDSSRMIGCFSDAQLSPGMGDEVLPLERIFAQYANFLGFACRGADYTRGHLVRDGWPSTGELGYVESAKRVFARENPTWQ